MSVLAGLDFGDPYETWGLAVADAHLGEERIE